MSILKALQAAQEAVTLLDEIQCVQVGSRDLRKQLDIMARADLALALAREALAASQDLGRQQSSIWPPS